MTRRLALPALALAAVLVLAGCYDDGHDPTTRSAPPSRGEPPTTATMPPPTTGADCPVATVECPRPWVTPGAVIPSDAGVCQASFNPRRELSVAAKRRVLATYGLPADQRVSEWDHLVSRWAGGTSTSSNVWPQVDPSEKARKDALESRLYHAVCTSKTLSLAVARQRMREFWRFW